MRSGQPALHAPAENPPKYFSRDFGAERLYWVTIHLMNAPEPDDSLPRTLADWRVTPRRDPQFRSAVWARLAATRRAPAWTSYARAHSALVAGALAVAVVLGALGGRERARARVEAESDRLASSYVRAMDARTMRLP